MMKRWLSITMVCLILLSGCGGKGNDPSASPSAPPSPEQSTVPPSEGKELAAVRAEIADSGALVGVAYLGWAELPAFEDVSIYLEANGFGEVYPFLYEIPEERLIRQEGFDIFAVVPASPDVKLTVCEYVMDEDLIHAEPGEELLTVTDGQPVLIMGTVTDIISNLFIRAEDSGGLCADYAPYLSMEDGYLWPGEGVYDFTPTELLGQYGPGGAGMAESDLCGTWYARHYDGNGEPMAMVLTLSWDGWAEYYYGYPYSDIMERFEGSWSLAEGQQLVLDLYGGPENWEGSETSGEKYEMCSLLHYGFNGSALMLEHEGDSALLYATEGETYSFLPFDGYHLTGDWIAESDYWGWSYELELFDNGKCWFNIYGEDGEMLAIYQGWWSVEDDILNLSVDLFDGQYPETPELDYIGGCYSATLTGSDSLVLEFVSGSILTVNMEGESRETFERYSDTYGDTPVSVHYSQDVSADLSDSDWVIVDDTEPVDAVFCTMVPVEDFKVVSLFMQEDMSFDVTELYDYGTLDPDRPLIVTLTIYGTIPSYGISFADPSGVYRLYGVTLSGLDGSLELTEIN